MSANQHKLKLQLAERGISTEEWREAIYPDFKNDKPQIPEKKTDLTERKKEVPEQDYNMDVGSFTI